MPEYKYDLAIAYRIYPQVSKVPPIYSDDKFKLASLCLRSLKNALGDLNVIIYAILDSCPKEYEELFRAVFPENLKLLNVKKAGNAATFKMQMDILLNQDDAEYVYFAEDDYFYLPDSMPKALDFLKNNPNAAFVTLYDHLDYYEHPLHDYPKKYTLYKNQKWKECATTCLTFLTSKDSLTVTKSSFYSYIKKNYDNALWLSITKYRIKNPYYFIKLSLKSRLMLKMYIKGWMFTLNEILFGKKMKLFAPEPSLATHMDSSHLPPGVDWRKEFEKLNYD